MKTRILDLINFERVNHLLEGFTQTTGFSSAILDLEGNILSKAGWREICTEFHRIHPETSKRCSISDTLLAGKLAEGEKYHFYKCLNGLVDVAVPIVIKGEHIANLFSGQFFFEEPDGSFFKNQAKKYGFDEELYLKALGKIPVFSEEKVKLTMDFLQSMTQLISEMAFQKMEQMELNEALQKNEERYRLVLENSMDAILLLSPDGSILSANQAACEIFQRSEEAISQLGIIRLIDKSDPRWSILMKERKLTGRAKGELLMLRIDGTKFPVELSSSVFTDQSGMQQTSMIIRDITKRKLAEKELLKLSRAVQQSSNSIIITDINGNIEYANPNTLKLTGYSSEEMIGQNPRIFSSGETPADHYQLLWETILSGNEWEGEFHNKRKNGDLFWESATISPILNEKGEIIHFLAIKRDVTESKKQALELIAAKEHAEESERLKTAFLTNMSHEIRTPLNSIIGFSDLLNDPNYNQKQKSEFTKNIINNGNNLLVIISDILDLSMIVAGQMKIKDEHFSVQKLLEELENDFRRKASDKGIELRLAIPSECPEIILVNDKYRIRQILVNFISNALKFTSEGFVVLGFSLKDNRIQFHVKDSGIGIDPENFEAIFDRFRQVETTQTRRYGGSGLGLAISKNLAELCGGRIGVKSEFGTGSTFYLSFPISTITHSEIASSCKRISPVKESSIRNLKILIVEDDQASKQLISISVKKFGKEIINVETGTEAVKTCHYHPDIDLVLMDIQLSEMNGYEATRQIRTFNQEIVIIAQTAFAQSGDREKAIEAGCNDYISKPIHKDELLAVIQKYFKK